MLIEETIEADASATSPYAYSDYDQDNAATRLVGRYLDNDATTDPLFTYYDRDGNELGPTPLSPSNRLAIDAVGINLTVKKDSSFAPNPTVLQNRVRLPNVDYQEVA